MHAMLGDAVSSCEVMKKKIESMSMVNADVNVNVDNYLITVGCR